jgi:hypothetical protein
MFLWEVFEWMAGLYDPMTHFYDTTKDTIVGLCGGVVGYILLKQFKK